MKKLIVLIGWYFSMLGVEQHYSDHFRTICLDHWGVDKEEQAYRPLCDTDDLVHCMNILYMAWHKPDKNKKDFAIWYTKFFGFDAWLKKREQLMKDGKKLYTTLKKYKKKRDIESMLLRVRKLFNKKENGEHNPLLDHSTMDFIT